MVLSSLSAHHESWVIGRRGNHAENFSCSRFYRYYTADLSFKKSFAKSLKLIKHIFAHPEMLEKPLDGPGNCREVLDFFGCRETGRAAEIVAERIASIIRE